MGINNNSINLAKKLDTIWLKATVLGSLWGAVEIILGSFLHNLRVPFSGTFLSAFAVILLVAGHRLWSEKGLIWRAALICALMKSISPSAMIFGPMICIFAEGLFMEIAIRLLGSNILGYMIGGGLAVLVSLIYKISFLLITYGFDLAVLYDRLYVFVAKQMNSTATQSWRLIIGFAVFYMIIGMLAAILGFFTHKKYRKQLPIPEIINKPKTDIFAVNTQQRFSIALLFFHICMIIIGLAFLNQLNILIATSIMLVYVSLSVTFYRSSLKRLKKPMLWIQFFVITLLAGLFLSNLQESGNFFTSQGIITGLKMNVRAIIIVLGFASLSVELRNPSIKLFFGNKRMEKVYLSLELAFEALPTIIADMASPRKFISNPMQSLAALINQAEGWLQHFSNKNIKKPNIVIITGKKGEGKTTFLIEIVNNCKAKKIETTGILQLGFWENNKRHHFDIIDIKTNQSMELCSIVGNENQQKFGSFYFNNDALEFGKKALSLENIQSADIVFIDEIGMLELQDNGWAESLKNILEAYQKTIIISVREDFVDEVINKWGLQQAKICTINQCNISELLDGIKNTSQQNNCV